MRRGATINRVTDGLRAHCELPSPANFAFQR